MTNRRVRASEESIEKAIELVLRAQDEIQGHRFRVACVDDSIDQLRQATTIIKEFAYAGNGLNKSEMSATQYAQEWLKEYPCSAAASFSAIGKNIYTFAYAGNGLNMSGMAANRYTREKMEPKYFTCADGQIFK